MLIIFDLRPLLHKKVSGVEVFTKNIAKEFVKQMPKNWKLVFWTNASNAFDFGEFQNLGTCIQARIPNKIFNLTNSLFAYPKIDNLVLKELKNLNQHFEKVDYIFIPDPRPSAVSKNCKKIFTIHDLSPLHFPETFSLKTRIFHKLLGLNKEIQESEKIVTVSEFSKKDIQSQFSQAKNKVEVLYGAAEKEYFNQACIPIKPKKIKGFNKTFFLALSTQEPRKNITRLLEAFHKALEQDSRLQLILVGKQNPEIFAKINISKSFKSIIFIERFISIQEKKWLYLNAQAFLFPSLFEGFGLPIVEAMSQGCPVIYGNNSSMPEVAGDIGIAVDANNTEEITQAILKLSKENQSAEQKKKTLAQSQKFSWRKSAKRLIELIKA